MELTAQFPTASVPHRYEVHGRIGEGSSSVVYRAIDTEKNLVVALKRLRYPESEERFNFKQEFRSLRDIYHPNLAQLYDLFDGEDHCFIAMELVEGSDFVSFARRSQNKSKSIRLALAHLVRGLTALHAAGKAHRDIKPTNVIVERSGRAVLVDFGLCMDLRPSRFQFATQSLRHAGTPAYMAPERLESDSTSEISERLKLAIASDWYSVGAMLYEALVGVVPYCVECKEDECWDLDKYCRLLRESQRRPPKPPRELNHAVPEDLSQLALSLLRWDPSARPTDSEMAKFAASLPEESCAQHLNFLDRGKEFFVGRAIEEEKLQHALRCRSRKHATVIVEGISGIGKTALIEHFLSSAFEADGILVLRSRCHHQEKVKYNAVDGLIDNLSTFLRGRQSYMTDVSGENLKALSKVFPVLERITPNQAIALSTDHQLVLQQAMVGLRQLLTNITKDRPLVVWIDDFQWCDPTSLSVLREVFAHPESPQNLLIISFRSEDSGNNDVIKQLWGGATTGMSAPLEHIKLSPLSNQEIRSLVSKVEGLSVDNDKELLQRISEDTGGLPLFVREWAYRYREMGKQARENKIDVGSLLKERVASLPRKLRDILEIVAVSSRPLEEKVLIEVAGPGSGTAPALYRLCHEHLLRKTLLHGEWSFESYHDKIRGAAQKLLGADNLRARHRQIADVLKTHDADPEILLEHYLGADDRIEAATHAKQAAHNSVGRLAFDRGAELFGLAMQLRGRRREDFELLEAQADALANAGHTKKAARTYYKAALNAQKVWRKRDKATQIRVKAAEQALTGGFFQSGRKLLCGVFNDLELSFPTSPLSAHVLSIKNRLSFWLWLRSHARFLGTLSLARNKHDDSGDSPQIKTQNVTPRDLRLDTLWVASRNMTLIDYVVGEAMTSWYLAELTRNVMDKVNEPLGSQVVTSSARMALSNDRSSRLLRALGLEASIYANIGWPSTFRRSSDLLCLADELLQHSHDEYDHAFLNVCRTSIEFVRGNWRSCRDLAQKTVAQYQEKFTEKYQEKATEPQSAFRSRHWDITVSLGFELSALVFLGELSELRQKMPNLLDDAERMGDRYRATVFASSYTVFLPLADDCPDRALENAEALIKNIPSDEFISLHFSHFISIINTYLYQGRAREAWLLVEQRWPLFQKAWLHWTGCVGSQLLDLRARTALAAAREEREKGSKTKSHHFLRVARRDATAIARRQLPHAQATAASIRAGVAAINSDSDTMKEQLLSAKLGFADADMKLHHAAAGLSLGSLVGGDEGRDMLATSMEFFRSEGIKNPKAMATLLFPGILQT